MDTFRWSRDKNHIRSHPCRGGDDASISLSSWANIDTDDNKSNKGTATKGAACGDDASIGMSSWANIDTDRAKASGDVGRLCQSDSAIRYQPGDNKLSSLLPKKPPALSSQSERESSWGGADVMHLLNNIEEARLKAAKEWKEKQQQEKQAQQQQRGSLPRTMSSRRTIDKSPMEPPCPRHNISDHNDSHTMGLPPTRPRRVSSSDKNQQPSKSSRKPTHRRVSNTTTTIKETANPTTKNRNKSLPPRSIIVGQPQPPQRRSLLPIPFRTTSRQEHSRHERQFGVF